MIVDGRVLAKPLVAFADTKANVEAVILTAADEGALAYATDTNEFGTYDGSAWAWGVSVDHNTLGGLQGGIANEYYHLTATQHTAVVAMVTAGLDSLTTAEVDQLENIGVTTISAAQWGYLGGMDQGVATGDITQFGGLGIRAALGAHAAEALYVPWIAGDSETTAYFGSGNAANDCTAVWGESYSHIGVVGQATTGYGLVGASATGTALHVNLTGAGVAIAQFADGGDVKVQIEDGGNITLAAGITVDGVDLSAWLDQSVKQAASPTFVSPTVSSLQLLDTGADHTLSLTVLSNLTANRLFAFLLSDTDHVFSLQAPLFVVEANSYVNQDLTTDASPTFVSPTVDSIVLKDGITAPGASVGWTKIYVDAGDGDLKVKFGDGHVAVIAADS